MTWLLCATDNLLALGRNSFRQLTQHCAHCCASRGKLLHCGHTASAANAALHTDRVSPKLRQRDIRRVSWALQDYYREGEGSLMQCVPTPADAYMPLTNEAIAAKVDKQVGFQEAFVLAGRHGM